MNPEILHTRLFKNRFMDCLSRRPLSLQVAVPYIGKIPPFPSIVELSRTFLSGGHELFQIVTRPPNSGNGTIRLDHANLIVALGVDLMIRKKLHSKVYQFTFPEGDRAAFVGSANLTAGGFERNDETIAFFRGKADNDAVAVELDRISGYGAVEFAQWKSIGQMNSEEI